MLSLCFLLVAAAVAGTVHPLHAPTADVLEQHHLALTENAGEMRVTFVILGSNAANLEAGVASEVRWGTAPGANTHTAMAKDHTYTDGGFSGTIYEAVMTGLADGTEYFYSTGTIFGGLGSQEFSFTYRPDADSIRFLSYGDMGVKNSHGTYTLANADAATGAYDLLVNVGDTSYADDYKRGANAYIFDEHFRNIEPHAACMPFMTCPGNHESQYDFAGYLNRLHMPTMAGASAALGPFYYSFDYGPVHFLVYSSEHTFEAGSEQHGFIAADLLLASAPAQRAKRPWIVMWSHRPLYCSDLMTWRGRCLNEANKYRQSIEPLMVAAKVDVHISGHNHQYERSHPVSGCGDDYKSGCNVTTSLHNAVGTVHIVNGAAGDVEGADPTWQNQGKVPFRAVHDTGLHTGYARVSANRTALDWSFIYSGSRAIPETNSSDDKDAGKVFDHFTLTKDQTWWGF